MCVCVFVHARLCTRGSACFNAVALHVLPSNVGRSLRAVVHFFRYDAETGNLSFSRGGNQGGRG